MTCCIDIIIGILIIVYILSINILSSTTIIFSIPLIIIGLLFILHYFFNKYLCNKKYVIMVKRCLTVLFCASAFFFMLIEAFIIGYPKINRENSDYIIILGCTLKNSYNISKTLRDRLDTTVKSIYTDGDSGYVVVSGGQKNMKR